MKKREIQLPPAEELIAHADAGRFDDRDDDYLPECLYTRKPATPMRVRRATRRRTTLSLGQTASARGRRPHRPDA